MRFYGRKNELDLLELLHKNKPSFVVITGKRRVGKTELVKQFIQNKKSLYLYVDNNKSFDILLSEYENQVKEDLKMPEYVRFKNPKDLLEFLLDQKDIVIAFDEFQRFRHLRPDVITELQRVWDLKGNNSNIMLIVTGSSIGMMRDIFINRGSPLFKRADNILTLKTFSMKEVFEILEDFGITDDEERLNIYCLFGGTIYYYKLMEKYGIHTFKDAIRTLILDDLAPLRREIGDILIEEFGKEHASYYEILSALAQGKSTKKEIGDITHISHTSLSPYLYDLIELIQVVEHTVPATEDPAKTKKGRYKLQDPFFRFYFRFIYRDMGHYQAGNYDAIMERISSEWGDFRGRIFESIALGYLRTSLAGIYPRIDGYWDRLGREIDAVCLDKNKALLVEVKSYQLGYDESLKILDVLREKASILPFKPNEFTFGLLAPKIEMREKLEMAGIRTWTLEDMLAK